MSINCGLLGLIPAYAGRTDSFMRPRPRLTTHPRLRGADLMRCGASARYSGSSPLTRGGRRWWFLSGGRVRLIPAYAGRTTAARETNYAPWAHPRLRGADCFVSFCERPATGSSPLTRGGPHRAT